MSTEEQNKKQTAVGQYYLIEKVAQGGMAEIFKGLSYDVHGLKKTVCIKKILPHLAASEEFINSLIHEAKLAVKLVHGNIAQTYDLGKVGDDYFMVMEFVEGKSLAQINRKCISKAETIPIQHLVYFVSEVLNGLNYMHRRTDEDGNPLHIVHRDISPQNIMVSYSGTVKIIDFGIAKAAFRIEPTDSGMLKGKFAYMSPEQALGDSIDQRSDIFSLGVILYEMLTGKRLFKAEDNRETIRNVRRSKVEPPSIIKPDIPEELDRIVIHSLAKDKRRRYLFASEMRDELVKFLHTNFPNFKPSDSATFVQNLFKDETSQTRADESDSKTPHLIINHTNSALANDSQFENTEHAKIAFNFKDFMLDEEKPELVGAQRAVPLQNSQPELILLGEEHTIPIWEKAKFVKKYLLKGVIAIGIIAGIFAAVYYFMNKPAPPPQIVVEKPNQTTVVTNVPIKIRAANIELTTTPPGAKIYIDDQEISRTTPTILKNLPVGKDIKIGIYYESYQFWSKIVSLKEGDAKSFDIQLVKDFGSILVESTPTDALVVIDTVPVGHTPLSKGELEPGKVYKIEIWKEGFEPHTQEIQAVAGRKLEVRAELTKEPNEQK